MQKPTIKKTASGKWHARVTIGKDAQGHKIVKSITASSKAEAERLVKEAIKTREEADVASQNMTVRQAIEEYISISEVLSPTTLDGYNKILRTGFQGLLEEQVLDLTDSQMQRYINLEAKRPSRTGGTISAKTVHNEYGLISSALKAICGSTFIVRLPKIAKKPKEYPDPREIVQLLKGKDFELPCLLAMWLSFSMSEIRGLMCSDIKDGVIHINRVVVDVKGVPTYKDQGKVDTRLRMHVLPEYIMQLIEARPNYREWIEYHHDSPLISVHRDPFYKPYLKLMKETGYNLTFHQLRHMSASIMMQLRVPDRYAQERGGWKTDKTLKSVYQHTFSDERRAVDKLVDDYMQQIIDDVGENLGENNSAKH